MEYSNYIDNEVFYEPEEKSLTRFNISICELYNSKIHGKDNSNVLYHYIVISRYKNIDDINIINNKCKNRNNQYYYLNNKRHNIFKNYEKIITNQNYIKPEIIECIYLNTGHCVAILKTFWIKIIQRKWRNILKERKKFNVLLLLKYRQIFHSFKCKYPTLKGMLSNISTKFF